MPYINQRYRKILDKVTYDLWDALMDIPVEDRPGCLTYVFYKTLISLGPKRYNSFALSLGILEAIKQEYYRRIVAPYENEKIKNEGDVE